MAKLTFILQDGQEVEVPLRKEIIIGRSEDNEVVVDAPSISARHACVKPTALGGFEVFDLQSEGGTYVNGERVDQQVLAHGDRLKFGLLQAVFAQEVENSLTPKENNSGFDWMESSGDNPGPVSLGNQRRSSPVQSQAEVELALAMEKVAVCEAELQSKRSELDEVRTKLSEAEEISRDLVDELQVLETRRDTMMGQLRDADARLEAMQTAYTQAEQGREQHEQRLLELKDEITCAEAARDQAVENRQNAEKLFAEQQARLEAMSEEAGVAADRLEVVSGQLRAVLEEESRRTAEVDRLLAEEQRLNALLEGLCDLESRFAQRQQEFADLNEGFEQKHEKWLELLNQKEATSGECEAMRQQHADVAARLLAVSMEKETASQQLENTLREMDGAASQLELISSQIAVKKQEVGAYQGQLLQLQATRDALQQRVDALAGKEAALFEAESKLKVAVEKERELQIAIAALAGQRIEDEKNLAQLTLSLEKLEYDVDLEAAKLQDLKDKTQTQQSSLDGVCAQLATAINEFQEVSKESARASQEMAARRTELEGELHRLTTDVETMSGRLEEVSRQRAELARQCEELSDTEQKLEAVKAELLHKGKVKEELDALIADLGGQRGSLERVVVDLSSKEKASQGRVEKLLEREENLKQSIESLAAKEQVDRERFQAIQNLIMEAENEKRGQAERLEREVLLKQRQLIEIEDRLEPLLRWKETMDQRYQQLQALPDSSEEARALWRQLEADKHEVGQVFTSLAGSGANAYQHGPALRGHARQLEAKIRRDEERYATLRRKVEQLEAEEVERVGRLSDLEKRLAALQIDITRVERENVEMGFESVVPVASPDYASSKGILGNIIDGARSKLKTMRPPYEVGSQR